MLCFYHGVDLDGICSGAILRRAFPNATFIPIDYWMPAPWDLIRSNLDGNVFIADFCFSVEDMKTINRTCRLIWCDHHKTSLEAMDKAGLDPEGLRDEKESGCSLTYKFLAKTGFDFKSRNWKENPRGINLLKRYDLGYIEFPILPYQFAVKAVAFDHTHSLWDNIFRDDDQCFNNLVGNGQYILSYVTGEAKRLLSQYGYEVNFAGHKTLIINLVTFPGLAYCPLETDEYRDFDLFVFFVQLPDGRLRFTVTSRKEDIHCGDLCRSLYTVGKADSGGGHKQVAGLVLNQDQVNCIISKEAIVKGVKDDRIKPTAVFRL